MTDTTTDRRTAAQGDIDVRPFRPAIAQADLIELRRRLQATRWPEQETVGDETQGVRYGFSARPATTGWGPVHVADAWIALMRRLGYDRYVAQGGDWGAQTADVMGSKAPPELAGIHSTMPGTVPPDVVPTLGGTAPPDGLSAEETAAWTSLNFLYTKAPRSWTERAYPALMYFNEVDAGNHFAARQEPELFTTEVRAAFRSLR